MPSSERVRVLIIGDAASIAMEQWVREMVARGHQVRVLSPNPPRAAIAELCATTEASPRIPFLRFAFRILAIRREVRDFNPDVVHGHGALNYGLWATLAGFCPTLVTCWGSDVLIAPSLSAVHRWKVRRALRGAGHVTATSQSLLDAAAQLAGRRQLQGEVLHWGVDTDIFRPAEDIHSTGVTILSLRAHKSLYNIDVILRAFARVRSTNPRVSLVVAHHGAETSALRELASDLGLLEAVQFIGWIGEEQLPEVYRSADIYVSVPSSDASAVSNLEAMASGLAIVASDLPATREWIETDLSGILVPAGDVESLAGALSRLVDDSGLRQRLGAAAREVVVAHGSRQSQMDRASELYFELAEGVGK